MAVMSPGCNSSSHTPRTTHACKDSSRSSLPAGTGWNCSTIDTVQVSGYQFSLAVRRHSSSQVPCPVTAVTTMWAERVPGNTPALAAAGPGPPSREGQCSASTAGPELGFLAQAPVECGHVPVARQRARPVFAGLDLHRSSGKVHASRAPRLRGWLVLVSRGWQVLASAKGSGGAGWPPASQTTSGEVFACLCRHGEGPKTNSAAPQRPAPAKPIFAHQPIPSATGRL